MKYLLLLILVFCLQAVEAETLRGVCARSNVKGMIGARINNHGVISAVRYRSPAQLAGIRAGDRINLVNYQPFSLTKIHGAPGEHIVFTIYENDAAAAPFRDVEIPFVDEGSIDYKTDPDLYYDERKIVDFGEQT